MERTVTDIGQKEATGMLRRLANGTAHETKESATMMEGGGLRWVSRVWIGDSMMVLTERKKPGKSLARPCSEGMMLGKVEKWRFGGLGSAARRESHSSETMKEMRMLGFLRERSLQKLMRALMWPLPG